MLTTVACPAGIHQAANSGIITYFQFGDFSARFGYFSYDFVPGNSGVNGSAPIVPGRVQIGMANTAIQDFDLYIVWHYSSALYGHFFQGGVGSCSAECFNVF